MSDNNDKYTNMGNDIRDNILDAISTGNVTGLSDTIQTSIDMVLADINDQIDRGMSRVNASAATAREQSAEMARLYRERSEAQIQRNKELRAQRAMQPNQARRAKARINEVGAVSSLFQKIGGWWILSIFGLAALGAALDFEFIGMLFCIIFALGGGMMIRSGNEKSRLLKAARRYRDICGEEKYATINRISEITGDNRNKVIKQIKQMLNRGIFPEGAMDSEQTTLILSKEVYAQYEATKQNIVIENQDTLADQGVNMEKVNENLNPEQQAELNAMMTEGKRAVTRLHELNDQIPGEAITAKLNKLEQLLNEIFARVKEHPEQMNSCHKLMEYYLPMMLKLVEAYADYDRVSEPGQEIIAAKGEIEKTIDTINQAFVELLNKLFRDSVWDVTSDAQVLKTMLKQEGLTKDGV